MKTYTGERTDNVCRVWVDQDGQRRELPLRLDLRNHSPTGFEWGYGGSGPAQLALAILADLFGPGEESRALALYQRFKFKVVGNLGIHGWAMTEAFVRDHVAVLEGASNG